MSNYNLAKTGRTSSAHPNIANVRPDETGMSAQEILEVRAVSQVKQAVKAETFAFRLPNTFTGKLPPDGWAWARLAWARHLDRVFT